MPHSGRFGNSPETNFGSRRSANQIAFFLFVILFPPLFLLPFCLVDVGV
jgi:hypothetical protein